MRVLEKLEIYLLYYKISYRTMLFSTTTEYPALLCNP
ncbi:Protein of unknown function [Pyronema omphalodes CBS 100304]|uniref:Uncharacterized protein n=1 Tax=Pyronema omphalodes (strain CBS 100304) TaxID=1076935 RepID=U4L451_PYROM|nr:Protein of unknown function [Pyronema omphalodes CBS 100304]